MFGWVAAIIMHQNHRSSIGAFHLRQLPGIILKGIAVGVLGSILGGSISGILSLALFVLWVIGFLGAINGQERPLPLIGEFYQNTFASIN